jgi:hypothetical protein
MASVSDQYLYISSKNRHSGDPHDFDVVIDTGLITCKDYEQIRLSLVKLSMPLTINQINTLNNDIVFTNKTTNQVTNVVIPVGNWNVYDLALYVKSAYNSISSLTFSKFTNHYVFTFTQPHQITFTDNANVVFGFSTSSSNIATTIESDVRCQPNSINDIILSIYGVSPVSHNLDNLATKGMRLSRTIGMMSIEDIPFGVLRYENISGEFAVAVSERDIKKLRFVMTGINNIPLSYCNMPEYTLILKVSIRSKGDETLKTLKELKEFSRLQFLHTTMG